MASSLIARLSLAMRKINIIINNALRQQFQPGLFAVTGHAGENIGNNFNRTLPTPQGSCHLANFLKNTVLYAAPRNRRTIERRLNRKFGSEDQVYKLMMPKTNLLVCNSCGNNHESGVLCSQCYNRVCIETEEMQKAVQADLGLNPVDREVVVLYEGETQNHPDEFWEGKRIVEMKKPRPAWFDTNLLQHTTVVSSSSSKVKPKDLA